VSGLPHIRLMFCASGVVLPSTLRTCGVQGHNRSMTCCRIRGVLLLFLVLNVTACKSWQSLSLDAISPAQLIEETQPERVRVLIRGGTEIELENPSVEGDELVGREAGAVSAYGRVNGVLTSTNSVRSIPLADILRLEARASSRGRTFLSVLVVGAMVFVIQGLVLPS